MHEKIKQYTYSEQCIKTAMNIDKFGHHVHKRLRLAKYIDTLNDTLEKTMHLPYALRFKIIKNKRSNVSK